jgi:hypothetical protein
VKTILEALFWSVISFGLWWLVFDGWPDSNWSQKAIIIISVSMLAALLRGVNILTSRVAQIYHQIIPRDRWDE